MSERVPAHAQARLPEQHELQLYGPRRARTVSPGSPNISVGSLITRPARAIQAAYQIQLPPVNLGLPRPVTAPDDHSRFSRTRLKEKLRQVPMMVLFVAFLASGLLQGWYPWPWLQYTWIALCVFWILIAFLDGRFDT